MLAQTISSRNPTAPISTISAGRDALTSCSCAGTTRALQPALLSLNSAAMRLASSADFFLRLLRRRVLRHASDHRQRSRSARAAVHVFRIERQRRPHFHVGAGRELEHRRHHADHGERHRIELDRLADDFSIRAKHARPEAVAQHHDAVVADGGFFGHERAAEDGVGFEHGEQVRRRAQAGHVLRIAGALVAEVDVPVRRERFEALRLALPVFVGRHRHRPLVAVGIDLPQHRDLLGILVRQRVEDDGLDDAEDGGVGADAEREREHGDQHKGRLPAQGAEGVGEGGGPVSHAGIVAVSGSEPS